jgi:hypothetical protein
LRSAITQQQKMMLLVGEPHGLPFARTAGQFELVLLIPGIVSDVDQLRSTLELHAALVEAAVVAGIVPDVV